MFFSYIFYIRFRSFHTNINSYCSSQPLIVPVSSQLCWLAAGWWPVRPVAPVGQWIYWSCPSYCNYIYLSGYLASENRFDCSTWMDHVKCFCKNPGDRNNVLTTYCSSSELDAYHHRVDHRRLIIHSGWML